MIHVIGWMGQMCLAVCAAPQALQSLRTGTSAGVNLTFLSLWFVGELLSLMYVVAAYSDALPIIFNYCINMLFVSTIMYYKLFPRFSNDQEGHHIHN